VGLSIKSDQVQRLLSKLAWLTLRSFADSLSTPVPAHRLSIVRQPQQEQPLLSELDLAARERELVRWISLAQAGSQSAFGLIYRRFAPMVHAILLGRFRVAIADELTQECFATAFAQLKSLREAAKFGPWIAAIARRARASDHALGAHGPEHAPALDDRADADASLEQSAEVTQVLRKLHQLPEAYRETLLMRLVEGLSGPEIAELTGLTAASVRVNLHRGMAKLRDALGLAASGLDASGLDASGLSATPSNALLPEVDHD
jgi:RNA polymerase sigma-70 factor, ECF subfamily